MSEIIRAQAAGGMIPAEEVQNLMEAMAEQLGLMADMLRTTNERMAAMEKTIRTLEKATPGQAADINRAIRERAKEICGEYRMSGTEKAVASAIRKTVREMTGVKTAREVARCDVKIALEMIRGWEEYPEIQAIRKKAKR